MPSESTAEQQTQDTENRRRMGLCYFRDRSVLCPKNGYLLTKLAFPNSIFVFGCLPGFQQGHFMYYMKPELWRYVTHKYHHWLEDWLKSLRLENMVRSTYVGHTFIPSNIWVRLGPISTPIFAPQYEQNQFKKHGLSMVDMMFGLWQGQIYVQDLSSSIHFQLLNNGTQNWAQTYS